MKKAIIHFFSRGLLINILVLFFIAGCSYFRNDSDLAIDDRTNYNFVGIYGKDSLELQLTDTTWVLNKKYSPDPVALDNFFYTLENLEIIGATTGGDLDSLLARKIILRSDRKTLIYRFYFSPGYYLLHHEGSNNIYRINLPASPDARLEQVFSDNMAHWRNRVLFSPDPDEVREVKVLPGQSYGEGFIIRKDSMLFKVLDLEGREIRQEKLIQERSLLYISYLEDIYFTDQVNTDSTLERISTSNPFYSFNIQMLDRTTHNMNVFPLYDTQGSKELFYGAVQLGEGNEVYRVNFSNLDPLFQDLNYFTVE